MRKLFSLLLFSAIIFSCTKKEEASCDLLKYGTFDVYEKGHKVGTFYRKDSMQVETYVGKKITGLTSVKQTGKCQYRMRSHWIKKNVDTINFTVNYTVKSRDEIIYELTPTYLKTKAKLKGKIIKVSDSIDAEILKKFGKL